ncbi:MFS transporter, partial [Burkholderia sp. Ac-20379]|nr:MFS transporter [Burkholderia sp. Ac-20379]
TLSLPDALPSRHGPTLALGLGAGFSAAASLASGLRLFAPSHRSGQAVASERGAK